MATPRAILERYEISMVDDLDAQTLQNTGPMTRILIVHAIHSASKDLLRFLKEDTPDGLFQALSEVRQSSSRRAAEVLAAQVFKELGELKLADAVQAAMLLAE